MQRRPRRRRAPRIHPLVLVTQPERVAPPVHRELAEWKKDARLEPDAKRVDDLLGARPADGFDEYLEARISERKRTAVIPVEGTVLTKKQLSFRDVFTARYAAARFAIVRSGAVAYHESTETY